MAPGPHILGHFCLTFFPNRVLTPLWSPHSSLIATSSLPFNSNIKVSCCFNKNPSPDVQFRSHPGSRTRLSETVVLMQDSSHHICSFFELGGREGGRKSGCLARGNFCHSCCTETPMVLIDSCVLSPIPDVSVLSATQLHGTTNWGGEPSTSICFSHFAHRAQ